MIAPARDIQSDAHAQKTHNVRDCGHGAAWNLSWGVNSYKYHCTRFANAFLTAVAAERIRSCAPTIVVGHRRCWIVATRLNPGPWVSLLLAIKMQHHLFALRLKLAVILTLIMQQALPVKTLSKNNSICTGIFDFYFVLDRYGTNFFDGIMIIILQCSMYIFLAQVVWSTIFTQKWCHLSETLPCTMQSESE